MDPFSRARSAVDRESTNPSRILSAHRLARARRRMSTPDRARARRVTSLLSSYYDGDDSVDADASTVRHRRHHGERIHDDARISAPSAPHRRRRISRHLRGRSRQHHGQRRPHHRYPHHRRRRHRRRSRTTHQRHRRPLVDRLSPPRRRQIRPFVRQLLAPTPSLSPRRRARARVTIDCHRSHFLFIRVSSPSRVASRPSSMFPSRVPTRRRGFGYLGNETARSRAPLFGSRRADR